MKYHHVFFFSRIPLGPIPTLFVKTALFSSSSEENRIPFQFTKLVRYCWTRLGQMGGWGVGRKNKKQAKSISQTKEKNNGFDILQSINIFLENRSKISSVTLMEHTMAESQHFCSISKQVIMNTATSLNSNLNTGIKIYLFCLFSIDLAVFIYFFSLKGSQFFCKVAILPHGLAIMFVSQPVC